MRKFYRNIMYIVEGSIIPLPPLLRFVRHSEGRYYKQRNQLMHYVAGIQAIRVTPNIY